MYFLDLKLGNAQRYLQWLKGLICEALKCEGTFVHGHSSHGLLCQ